MPTNEKRAKAENKQAPLCKGGSRVSGWGIVFWEVIMKNTKVTLVPLSPDEDAHDPDEGPDEMFHFIKVMK